MLAHVDSNASHICVKLETVEHEKPSSVAVLDTLKPEILAPTTIPRSKAHSPFEWHTYIIHIYSWMDDLVAAYPNLVTKVQIGTSYEGRPIYFSTGGNKRPAIWVDSGIHSREWVSQATGVWTVNKIVTDYGTDASLTSLLNAMDIYLLTLTNPDGYVHSHTSSHSNNPGSMCSGVNPNRDWDGVCVCACLCANTNPCSDSDHGPSPHSEMEVRNVVNLMKNHSNFKSLISIHAYSQLAAVQKLSSLHGIRYKVGSICKTIYQASSGIIDWLYKDIGCCGFILPANQIIPTASETWLGLKDIMVYVRDHPN
uniref:Peptidase M14 domain-containing protein n=1 Tax=Salmo trutta TaxID=8032 RepID=A0A674AU98_SALTR